MPRSLGIEIGTGRADFLLSDLSTGDAHSVKLKVAGGGLAQTVTDGVSRLLGEAGVQGGDLDRVVVALPQDIADGAGARVGLLVTRGFEQRLARAGGPEQGWLTRGVPERISASGNVLSHLDEDAAHRAIGELLAQRIDALAVCLMHGHRNPEHEKRLRALIADHGVEMPVFLSHEVAPVDGEDARVGAVLATARASRQARAYLDAVASGLAEASAGADIDVLQSTGERVRAEAVSDMAGAAVAGATASAHAAAARIAARAGFPDALSVEVGGAEASGALIRRGTARIAGETSAASGAIGLPSVDARPAGAGVEALVTLPMAGTVRVGPGTARPACAGGDGNATVMDALAVLRRLPVDRLSLDLDAAEKAVAALAGTLETDLHRTAEGVIALHAEGIAGALRRLAAEKGEDPAQLALVASGGAGPVVACDIAECIGVSTVIVPRNAGALGTEGCAGAGKARQFVTAPRGSGAGKVADAIAAAREQAQAFLSSEGGGGDVEVRADVRVPGANFRTSIIVPPNPGADAKGELERHAADAYRTRLGHAPVRTPVVTAIRAIATAEDAVSSSSIGGGGADARDAQAGQTQAWFDGGFETTPILDGTKLASGVRVSAPALILLDGTTVVVKPGWTGEVDKDRNVILRAADGGHGGKIAL